MKHLLCSIIALCLAATAAAQQKGFVIKGKVNMADGVVAGLLIQSDGISPTQDIADTVVKDGEFVLRGKVDHPCPATLTLNNLALVEKNHWPMDSVRWEYLSTFLSNDDITLTPDLKFHGSSIQADAADMQARKINTAGGLGWDSNVWHFIEQHPQSPVSLYLAECLLRRGYRLTDVQLDSLARTITSVPSYPDGFAHFKKVLDEARLTTVGKPLVDIEVKDTLGNVRHLTDIVPKGRYVLVDFWASWCGICIAAMPKVKEFSEKYKDDFSVIGVSVDTKDDAWRKAMHRLNEPWPQYITTEKGFKQLTDVLHIGVGVPYYLLVTPDGKVLRSPGYVEEIEKVIAK